MINQFPDRLTKYTKSGNTPNAFVIRKLGINQATFYKKQKDPRSWHKDELERIEEIVEALKIV